MNFPSLISSARHFGLQQGIKIWGADKWKPNTRHKVTKKFVLFKVIARSVNTFIQLWDETINSSLVERCSCCCCCCWVLRHFLTSYVISVASDTEHGKSDKFCSEALISTWGSFTCRKSTTRDSRLYFPSEGSHTQDFYALKKSIGRDRTREPRIQRRVW